MAEEHWFDGLHKRLTRETPWRGVLGMAVALTLGQRLSATGVAAKNGGRGGGNGKVNKHRNKKNRPKKPHKPKPPDECATTWPGEDQKGDRDHCRFVRRQCDEADPREFCIRDGTKPDGSPTKVAVCCDEGQTCCGGQCMDAADPYSACCDGDYANTRSDSRHCGACGNRCGAGETCVLGNCHCLNTCDDWCQPPLTVCGDECVDTKTDPAHCGGCFNFNPNGLKCCDGNLCTYINGVCCGGTCYPEGWPSCE